MIARILAAALALSACSGGALDPGGSPLGQLIDPSAYDCGKVAVQEIETVGCTVTWIEYEHDDRWLIVTGDDVCEAPRRRCVETLDGQHAFEAAEITSVAPAFAIVVKRVECGRTCAEEGQ